MSHYLLNQKLTFTQTICHTQHTTLQSVVEYESLIITPVFKINFSDMHDLQAKLVMEMTNNRI
jgi:hypothetical protein